MDTAAPTLADLVRDASLRHPDAVAIEAGDRALSYRELWSAAGRLARVVTAQDPSSRRVGLYATRDLETYVGYLAILRAGQTVVPISPEAPPARAATMLAAAAIRSVVAAPGRSAAARELLTATGCRIVEADLTAAGPASRAPQPADGAAEAYLLFTSGSTGVPKGVPIPHRAAVSYVRHIVERYALGTGCRLSQTFELTFDPSVFDIFGAWASGATLVVPGRRDLMMPSHYVNDRKLTHWFSVPSVVSLAGRLRLLAPNSMPGLVFSGFIGEPLTLLQARTWKAAAPHSTMENLYGPTELTVSCAEYTLPADPAAWPDISNGTVPIGRVFTELESLIVDPDGRGSDEGELLVRGSQRFDGYLDPQDNRHRFATPAGDVVLPRAAADAPGPDDWYRTGDRVRREDGLLVHLGRLDRQVKVRGYRIELGEIEQVIRGATGVRDAVVVAPVEETGELHGFYTGAQEAEQEITRLLTARLPPYMRPATITWIDTMPLNPNGKIDHAALATLTA